MSLKEVYQLNLASGFLPTVLRQEHELVILAGRIDWDSFVDTLRSKFSKNGRKAKRLRLMIGLHLLKHLYNLSDELVCNMLDENLYFRYFCGVDGDITEWMSKKLLNPCTMSRFRQRLGLDGMKLIEDVIKIQLRKDGRISPKTQIVDTTAMEKNIAYPINSNLMAKGMQRTIKIVNKLRGKGLSVSVRSYSRLIRREILKINKLGRGRRARIEEGVKRLTQYAKQVSRQAAVATRAIKRGATAEEADTIKVLQGALCQELGKLNRVADQAEKWLAGERVKDKVLSMHEPDVAVIAKGKRGKRYEFGAKVSLSQDRNGYIVGHQEYQYNIADVNSIDSAIEDWSRTFGDYPDELGADRGYSTSNPSDTVSRIKKLAIPTRGRKRHPDHGKPHFKRILRLRTRIEPTIGHLKTDHRMNRCRYRGKTGDTLNVGFATAAWNLRKWAKDVKRDRAKAA